MDNLANGAVCFGQDLDGGKFECPLTSPQILSLFFFFFSPTSTFFSSFLPTPFSLLFVRLFSHPPTHPYIHAHSHSHQQPSFSHSHTHSLTDYSHQPSRTSHFCRWWCLVLFQGAFVFVHTRHTHLHHFFCLLFPLVRSIYRGENKMGIHKGASTKVSLLTRRIMYYTSLFPFPLTHRPNILQPILTPFSSLPATQYQ